MNVKVKRLSKQRVLPLIAKVFYDGYLKPRLEEACIDFNTIPLRMMLSPSLQCVNLIISGVM